MEGITGTVDVSIMSSKHHDYEKGRKLMAGDVNAPIKDILEADRNRSRGA